METRRANRLPSLIVEANGLGQGLERYKIKLIKKYNIKAEGIMPKYRSRPTHDLSCVIIGKRISYETARDYVLRYLNDAARDNVIISIRLQK